MLDDLFVNGCIVFSLVFIYMKLRWISYSKKWHPSISILLDGIMGGVMGFILMYFSIQVTEESMVDMRHIPVMIMILYIGKIPALISGFIIIFSRFFFGINAASINAMYYMIVLLAGYCIIDQFFKKRENSYVKNSVLILYSNSIFSLFAIKIQDYEILVPLLTTYWIISTLGTLAAIFLFNYIRKSELLFKKYETDSTKDFLTGLSNVREFQKKWDQMIIRLEKKEKPFSLLILDIDFFKTINDTYGHATGDIVLIEIGRIMEACVNKKGFVFRKGGEEFAILLPNCEKEKAYEIADLIRLKIEEYKFNIDSQKDITATVSIGLTSYPYNITHVNEMIEKADELLYQAKVNGRNRIAM